MTQGKCTNKIIIIGLDGATYTVLRPLIERGKLKTMAALMEKGSWAELNSTIPPLTAPAWASFLTGKNPGKHGIYHFRRIDRSLYDQYQTRIVNSTNLSGQVLWQLIGNENRKVGVINVPLSYPPYPVNGFMITGMLTPKESDHFTYPPELALSLKKYSIDISVEGNEYGVLDDLDTQDPEVLLELIRELNTLVDIRTETAIRLMNEQSPDCFMMLFTETDRLQHHLWPYLDFNSPQYEQEEAKSLRDAVENFYQNLDECLGKLFKTAGESSTKIIMSDHGFGPATTKNVNYNLWLKNLDLLKIDRNPRTLLNPKKWLKAIGLNREVLYSVMNSLFPGHMVRKMERTWGRMVNTPIDWKKTRAVFIPIFEFVGGIQIIQNGGDLLNDSSALQDYEDLRENLIKQLFNLKDPSTHCPIVLEAYRREELYHGAHANDAPDIIFIMASDYCGVKGLLAQSLVSVKPKKLHLWNGTHRQRGVVIINGPNIITGKISPPQIYDLTPTILYLMNIAIPEDMDGRVIEEAIQSTYLSQHEIKFVQQAPSAKGDSEAKKNEMSEEEMKKVRKQLESLGYF